MLSAFKLSKASKKTQQYTIEHPSKAPMKYYNKPLWVLSPDPATLASPRFFSDASKPRSRVVSMFKNDATLGVTSADDPFIHLTQARSYFADHIDRVADNHGHSTAVARHDVTSWATERPRSEDGRHTVLTFPSPVSPDTSTPSHGVSPNSSRSSLVLMEVPATFLRTVDLPLEGAFLSEATNTYHRGSTPLVPPGLGIPCPRNSVTTREHSPEELFEGRRRTGEILVRCGVICAPETLAEAAELSLLDIPAAPVIPEVTESVYSNDPMVVAVLSSWTVEWLHKLVLEPHIENGHRFMYNRNQADAFSSVVSRIRRVIDDIRNPGQVIVHALWFMLALTRDDSDLDNNMPFLGIPIFRYLHNNGACTAEDFMFRTFVACAMLGDKAVNDSNYSTKTWCCLTRLPVAILNATEMFILKTLRWNATMSDIQWDEMLAYLRAHIKTGGDFDPFGYDEDSPSGMMARMLDAWISMSQPAAPVTVDAIQSPMEIHAPQPIRPIPQFRLVDADEWCPEDDPIVSLKPRTVGVAPGADRRENELKAGTTAKDLLDSILGSTASADLAYMRRTTGTSFYGSFGAFGLRLANLAGTLQNPSWFPAQG